MRKLNRDFFSQSSDPPSKFKKPSSQRKLVSLIFLLTILAIAFFWFKDKLGQNLETFLKPATFEIVSPLIPNFKAQEKNDNPQTEKELIGKISDWLKNLKGEYGIYVYSLTSNKEYGLNERKVSTAASVNKVPIMLSFYKELEKDSFSLSDKYELKKEDIQNYGTGIMQYEEPGKVYTYKELLELSGKKSDNTAAHVLGKILGFSNLKRFIKDLGLKKTSIEENKTTPKEAGSLFVMTYKDKILKTEKYKKAFFSNLTETDFEDRIPAGIPENIKIAHKIGSGERIYNDCGIIFGKHPFVLCILSREAAENEALEVIPKIAKLVWEFEQH